MDNVKHQAVATMRRDNVAVRATALLDRFTHHCHILETNDSYRLKNQINPNTEGPKD